MTNLQQQINDLLLTNGWLNGRVLRNELELKLNFKLSALDLRKQIKIMRSEGVSVIGSNKGYKLPANVMELVDYIESRKNEIRSELFILGAMEEKAHLHDSTFSNLQKEQSKKTDKIFKSWFKKVKK